MRDLPAGEPPGLTRVAATLDDAAGDLHARGRLLRRSATQVTGDWIGAAAALFMAAADDRSERIAHAGRDLAELAHGIRGNAVSLDGAQREIAALTGRRAVLVEDLQRARLHAPHLVPALEVQLRRVEQDVLEVRRRLTIVRHHLTELVDRSRPGNRVAGRPVSAPHPRAADTSPPVTDPGPLVHPVWSRLLGRRMHCGPVAPVIDQPGRMHCGPVAPVIDQPGRMHCGPVAPVVGDGPVRTGPVRRP